MATLQSDGALIARLRRAKKLSLKGLAERSGIERNKIWRIENGKTRLTTDVARQLLAALGRSIVALAS